MSRDKNTLPQAGPVSSRRMVGRIRRIVAWSIVVLAVGLVGFAAFAWRPAIREVATPDPSRFSPVLIQQGAKLAAAGFCASCHSVAGAKPFAGGYAMKTGFRHDLLDEYLAGPRNRHRELVRRGVSPCDA
ncbi:hypothetical protein [Burkholderia cepacia]|uniref:hypothetical protein n=1 Tax=Burkholderia cepacia TaxID=292 RepID=UPI001ABAF059|nr:hypothetical protein [Burkholderia cepacia]